MRRADAQAARWAYGAAGEEATARLLDPLRAEGWHVWHDLRLTGRRFNVDHLLMPPTAAGLVMPDTKRWRRNWPTQLVGGRLHCGPEDRHGQAQKVAEYAEAVAMAVGLPPANVIPLLLVHGSPVAGGFLWAPVSTVHGRVLVVGPDMLLGVLRGAVEGLPDSYVARALAVRVNAVLRPYVQGA
ncbi:nuclease-related domain-containing protein [Streptomyces sp. 8L]|uniref:nuclease-related domain-containing protein n=1 Tax=Streptomyces sp. 8L TaxID=2877242 RepID=UPI001CD6D759|nr:nuclease-related domain-containing protein [Streptomyces sp. 8L]MCA1222454.1 NERD domain-containing protein [Streptomyces sp. 8L]